MPGIELRQADSRAHSLGRAALFSLEFSSGEGVLRERRAWAQVLGALLTRGLNR